MMMMMVTRSVVSDGLYNVFLKANREILQIRKADAGASSLAVRLARGSNCI